MASRSPLQGYNHNIRYRDRVYHVQTEDSGIDHPHLFTHLFFNGMIIASARTDYGELASQSSHEKQVRKLMQQQHKDLMKQLRHGEFDERIRQMLGSLDGTEQNAAADESEQATTGPPAVDAPASVTDAIAVPSTQATPVAEPTGPSAGAADEAAREAPSVVPPPPPMAQPVPQMSAEALSDSGPAVGAADFRSGLDEKKAPPASGAPDVSYTPQRPTATPPARAVPPPQPPRAPRVTGAYGSKPNTPAGPARPPRVGVADSRSKPGGAQAGGVYRLTKQGAKPFRPTARAQGGPAVVARPAVIVDRAPGRSSGSGTAGGPSRGAVPPPPGSSTPPRRQPPAEGGDKAVGGSTGAKESRPGGRSVPNLFGSDLISERSLDEVILQYLSEDGEASEE